MFRGLERGQARLAAGMVLGLFAAFAAGNWYNELRAANRAANDLRIQGAAQVLPKGAMSAAEAAGPVPRLLGKLDANSATATELEALPNVGPALAAELVRSRETGGPFKDASDLTRVPGIGQRSAERLAPYLEFRAAPTATPAAVAAATPAAQQTPKAFFAKNVDKATEADAPPPPATGPVRVNHANAEELESLEGIGPKIAQRILADRVRNGPFRGPQDLMRVKGIGPKTIAKNKDRLRYD